MALRQLQRSLQGEGSFKICDKESSVTEDSFLIFTFMELTQQATRVEYGQAFEPLKARVFTGDPYIELVFEGSLYAIALMDSSSHPIKHILLPTLCFRGFSMELEIEEAIKTKSESKILYIANRILRRYYDIQEFQDIITSWDNQKIEKFFKENADRAEWGVLCLPEILEKLSLSFIRDFKDNFDWDFISCKPRLSFVLLNKLEDFLNFDFLVRTQRLPETYILNKIERFNINDVFTYQAMSEPVIREYAKEISLQCAWGRISYNGKLSTSFLEEYKNSLNWGVIARTRIIKEEELRKFWDLLPNSELRANIALNKKLAKKYKIYTKKYNLEVIDEGFIWKFIKRAYLEIKIHTRALKFVFYDIFASNSK